MRWSANNRPWWPLIVMGMITSIALFERFAEVIAPRLGVAPSLLLTLLVIGYLAWVPVGLGIIAFARSHLKQPAWRAHIAFALGWALLAVIFIVVYPLADSGALGFSSDREEALNIAVRQVWDGNYPYHCRSLSGINEGCPQQGNLITPMPGALLLASPVVFVLGSASWLSLLSLLLLYVAATRLSQHPGSAVSTIAGTMLLAPIALGDILIGSDFLANAILVAVALAFLLHERYRPAAYFWAVVLALALCWRASFWLSLLPVTVYLLRRGEWRTMLRLGGLVLGVMLAVILPFVLVDPHGFSPWTVQQKFQQFDAILPHAGLWVAVATASAGILLGWRAQNPHRVMIAGGVMLMLPSLASALLNSVFIGHPTLVFFGWYALGAVGFFAPSLWPPEDPA